MIDHIWYEAETVYVSFSAVAAPCATHVVDGGGVWGGRGYWVLSQHFHLNGWNQGVMGGAIPFLILPPAPPAAAASDRILLSTRLILSNITKHGVLCVYSEVTINYHELVQSAETPLPWSLQLICMPHQSLMIDSTNHCVLVTKNDDILLLMNKDAYILQLWLNRLNSLCTYSLNLSRPIKYQHLARSFHGNGSSTKFRILQTKRITHMQRNSEAHWGKRERAGREDRHRAKTTNYKAWWEEVRGSEGTGWKSESLFC